MRKILLPTLLLLGVKSINAGTPVVNRRNLAEIKTGLNVKETPDELSTWSYHFEEITEFSAAEITEFWKNRTNGVHCTDIFTQILEKFSVLQEVVYDIEGLVETYNYDCSDKCLPGYVKCLNGPEDKCILECDCCALQTNEAGDQLMCCAADEPNHPVSDVNYNAGEGAALFCYEWCCPATSVMCVGTCIPEGGVFPTGYSFPETSDYDYGYEPAAPTFPMECCEGNECCDALNNEIWPLWISTTEHFCCVLDSMITNPNDYSQDCCCESADHHCCENLSVHCQPSSNIYCCDFDTEIVCNGECWPKDKPCCYDGETNCEYQDDACVSYCCCNPDTEECCEAREQCIEKDTPCCELDEKICYGRCIDENEYCCELGKELCEYTYDCQEHCCDHLHGFSWCERYQNCSTHCCEEGYEWCDGTEHCQTEGEPCCPEGEIACIWQNNECMEEKYCCEYSYTVHEVFCELYDECRDECDCCADDENTCLCPSGDTKCYKLDSKECCLEGIWCDKCEQCLTTDLQCCECDGSTYLGNKDEAFDDDKCCPAGSNRISTSKDPLTDPKGCCTYTETPTGPVDDCCGNATAKFNPFTNECEFPPELEPCPCEGCCDFNCCDELDFFMHKAFADYYHIQYEDDFMAFYDEWYAEFYSWWHSPIEEIGEIQY